MRDCKDPFIAIADEATSNTVKAGGPGAMLCDMFPARESIFRGSHGDFKVLYMNSSDAFVSEASTRMVPIRSFQAARVVHEGASIENV